MPNAEKPTSDVRAGPAPTGAAGASDLVAIAETLIATDPARSIEVAQAALRALGDDTHSETGGRAHRTLGLCLAHQGDPVGAMHAMSDALAIFARIGARRLEAKAHCDLASIRGNQLGMFAEAIAGFEQALAIAEEARSPHDEGRTLSLLGALFGRVGRLPEAERVLRRAVALLADHPDRRTYAVACNNLGYLFLQTDRHADAVPILEAGLARLDPARDGNALCMLRTSLALALAHTGQTDRSLQLLRENEAPATAFGAYCLADHNLTVGRVHLRAGRATEALHALRAALAVAEHAGLTAPAVECQRHLALAAEQQGDASLALQYERAYGQAERRLLDERGAAQLRTLETSVQLRARAQENVALERSRRLLRAVVDANEDLIYAKDERGCYALVNRAFLAFHGLRQEQVLGRTVAELFGSATSVAPSMAADAAVFATGQSSELEQAVDAPHGPRRLLVRRMPIQSPEGAPWLLGVARDVTELRRQEEELRGQQEFMRDAARAAAAANEAKSRFLANMSHEVRTPINGIMGMINLALRTGSAADHRRYLALAKSSADGLLAIVNDILDFSKIEAGKMTVERAPFDLHEFLDEVMRTHALKAAERRLALLARVAPDLPIRVRGDSTRLRQVLANLIGNAIKFTSVGDVTLEVAVVADDAGSPRIHFAVRDTGPGINPAQQAAIFEAFAQADESTTRHFGGTGLGLTISARLVELMGGRLVLASAPGEGACFSFELAMPGEPESGEGAGAVLRALPGVGVLLIDPDARCRDWTARMLAHWRVAADACATVAEALPLAEAIPHRTLLVDGAALAHGGEALPRLLRRASGATVIVLLAVDDTMPAEVVALAGDRAVVLRKPLLPADLHRALAAAAHGATAAEPPESVERTDAVARPFAGMRFLLVEDNFVNLVLAKALLQGLGAATDSAENGAVALLRMEAADYDLVLMDVQMPIVDGIEAVRRWREHEAHSGRVPRAAIVAMTAHALSGDRERLLELGFDGYVSKPFVEADLVTEAQRVLDGRPALRGAAAEPREFPAESFRADNLRRILQGHEENVRQAADAFAAVRLTLGRRLDEALARRDARAFREVMHEIKGMAGTIGARRMHAFAAAIEAAARRGGWNESELLLKHFDPEWQHVTREVETLRAGP